MIQMHFAIFFMQAVFLKSIYIFLKHYAILPAGQPLDNLSSPLLTFSCPSTSTSHSQFLLQDNSLFQSVAPQTNPIFSSLSSVLNQTSSGLVYSDKTDKSGWSLSKEPAERLSTSSNGSPTVFYLLIITQSATPESVKKKDHFSNVQHS